MFELLVCQGLLEEREPAIGNGETTVEFTAGDIDIECL